MSSSPTQVDYDIDDEIVANLCNDGGMNTTSDTGSIFGDTPNPVNDEFPDICEQVTDLDIPDAEEYAHVDQMEQMWRLCGVKGRKTVFQNLYSLLCGLAMDAVSTQHEKMDAAELYLVIFHQCEQAFKNLHIATQAQDLIFNHLPKSDHPSKWPEDFAEWWETKTTTNPPPSLFNREMKKYKNHNAETKQMAYFGFKAKEQFTSDRNYIRSHLNPKWIPEQKIPSGKNVHGVLHAIRMSCLPILADIRAKHAVNNDLKKLPVDVDKTTARAPLYEKRMKEYLAKLEETKSSFYPDCWMTFIYCALPSPKPLLNFIPSHGLSTDSFDHGTSSATPGTAFRNMLGRDRRRRLAKVGSEGTSEDQAPRAKKQTIDLTENNDDKFVVVHEVKELTRTPEENMQMLIESKQLELSLQQMLGKKPEDLAPLIEEIIDLARQKGQMHRALVPVQTTTEEETD